MGDDIKPDRHGPTALRKRAAEYLPYAIGALVGAGLVLLLSGVGALGWFAELPGDSKTASFILFVLGLVAETVRRRLAHDRVEVLRRACGEAIRAGTHLYRKRVKSQAEFDSWKQRISAWVNATAAELERLSGPGDALQFKQTPIVDAADIIGSFNASHTAWRLELEARLTTLRSIINR